eukprot:jgi/Chlat1/2587/Chrsp178S08719
MAEQGTLLSLPAPLLSIILAKASPTANEATQLLLVGKTVRDALKAESDCWETLEFCVPEKTCDCCGTTARSMKETWRLLQESEGEFALDCELVRNLRVKRGERGQGIHFLEDIADVFPNITSVDLDLWRLNFKQGIDPFLVVSPCATLERLSLKVGRWEGMLDLTPLSLCEELEDVLLDLGEDFPDPSTTPAGVPTIYGLKLIAPRALTLKLYNCILYDVPGAAEILEIDVQHLGVQESRGPDIFVNMIQMAHYIQELQITSPANPEFWKQQTHGVMDLVCVLTNVIMGVNDNAWGVMISADGTMLAQGCATKGRLTACYAALLQKIDTESASNYQVQFANVNHKVISYDATRDDLDAMVDKLLKAVQE